MKRKLIIATLFVGLMLPALSKAQCTVTKEVLGDGVVSYDGSNISIYEDSINGLQQAYLSWIVWKKGDNANSLKFFLHISTYTLGIKTVVVPNVVQFSFSNGRILEYKTQDILSNTRKGVKMSEALFPLEINDFKIFKTMGILSIKISDDTTNRIIVGHPQSDGITKQLNCLIEAAD